MKILCKCEDILESEIIHAVDKGLHDIESIKRLTGLGTGTCQGRYCVRNTVKFIETYTGTDNKSIPKDIVHRPPLTLLNIGKLAGEIIDND